MNSKKLVFIALGISLVLGVVFTFLNTSDVLGPQSQQQELSYEEAVSELAILKKKVQWEENHVKRRARVQLGKTRDLKKLLPPIHQFDLVVDPQISSNDVAVEIFVSTEKSGSGTDGWMVEIAQAFNQKNIQLNGGKRAKVKIRKIASGTGYQFIASKKHLPDAFSPSNQLWGKMVMAHGVPLKLVRERLVGNVAGVVMKSSVADNLRLIYPNFDIKSLIDSVVNGKLTMGYTNPFASSTGLNFLITVLAKFSEGEEKAMLSPEVLSTFESFQQGIPFVSLTTMQMRDSVQNDGSLEAFVMEYQTFINVPFLQVGYEFIPFGVLHNNPLYAVGNGSAEKTEVLEKLAAFAENSQFQKLASDYGFNPSLSYTPFFEAPSGQVLVRAQQTWKEKKDVGKPIVAVFLCDVSGSMDGSRISDVKKSLLEGSEFIASQNSIGLTLFSDQVNVSLPIGKFSLLQKASFHAAVQDMTAGGGTAMYDGITIALSQLVEEKEKNPNAKYMLFVLTDGETKNGMSFKEIRPALGGLRIPIYTIGYEANLSVLQEISAIVEAASLNAKEGEIQYKIGALLNAQM